MIQSNSYVLTEQIHIHFQISVFKSKFHIKLLNQLEQNFTLKHFILDKKNNLQVEPLIYFK